MSADTKHMGSLKVDYDQLERERAAGVSLELNSQLKTRQTSGSGGSLRQAVLSRIVEGDYEMAGMEIDAYIDERDELPDLRDKTDRYVEHCKELINAIETKRNFPGLSSLSASKQQEIMEKVIDHFDELKAFLKKIEKAYMDLRVVDVRSTVYVLKALSYTTIAIMSVAFMVELFSGLGDSLNVILDEFIFKALKMIF